MIGKLIVLCGINNVGKTTQKDLLVKRISSELKLPVEALKYPIYNLKPSGPMLDDYLRNNSKNYSVQRLEAQTLFAFNRYQYQDTLLNKLYDGINIISEDYIGTSIAWGMSYGEPRNKLEYVNSELRQADLTILLDGERFLTSIQTNHSHEQDYRLTQVCRANHLRLAYLYKWEIINANQPVSAVHKDIWHCVHYKLLAP